MNVEVPRTPPSDINLDQVLNSISKICPTIEIRKIHQDKNHFMIVAIMNFESKAKLSEFSSNFNAEYPEGRFTLLDDSSLLWSKNMRLELDSSKVAPQRLKTL